MAKKKPNTKSSTVNAAQQEPTQEAPKAPEKAAVNVDSKNEPKKAKNSAKKNSPAQEKKPNPFKRFGRWLKSVFSELKKVTWLKGKDVLKNTTVVLVVVVLFFVVLFIIDYVLAGLLGLIVDGKWATIFI
ncbi:MAG: preprotein translocase subunit SecE [Clostridia bacterium]|nr:preprotein translocase subunit SecE [Clostridia bacterium]